MLKVFQRFHKFRYNKIMTTKMKQCIKCHNSYPATTEHFYKRSEAADGLRTECKKCKIKNTLSNRSKRLSKEN